MEPNEKAKVLKLFESYEKALQSNIGLTNSFSFEGGTCGWAGNMLTAGTARIETFKIYDIAPDDTVYVYSIDNVNQYLDASAASSKLTKRVAGKVTRDSDGKVIRTTVKTPERTLVTDCTVYSKVSFPAKAPGIVNLENEVKDEVSAETKDYLDGKMRVTSSSTTSLKASDAFDSLNGNGWFN